MISFKRLHSDVHFSSHQTKKQKETELQLPRRSPIQGLLLTEHAQLLVSIKFNPGFIFPLKKTSYDQFLKFKEILQTTLAQRI